MPFLIEHALDFQNGLDIALDIHALVATAFVGLKKAELGFPEPQDIWGELRDRADFADFVEDLRA